MKPKKSAEKPYQVKGVDLLFQASDEIESSSSDSGVGREISLNKIIPHPKQPRKYFDQESLESLAKSIQEQGVLQAILVRQTENDCYEIVAGERRFRAAQIAGLEKIPAIVKELDDKAIAEIALLENIQREDLNPIEETQAVLELLALKLNQNERDVISMINTASHAGRESAVNVTRQNEWDILVHVLKVVGYTPESFRTQRLPLLKLPQDILEALQKGEIAYTKALALARGVKDPEQRENLLQKAIEENLSLKAIKERIAELKDSKNNEDQAESTNPAVQVVERMKGLYKQAKSPTHWKDKNKQKKLNRLLDELEKLLGS